MIPETLTAAPEFSLASVAGGSVRLADLHSDGPALLLFVSEECPTCVLTLRRLAPILSELAAAGVRVAALFEDPLEVAARVARRTGFDGVVLSEPSPYQVSDAYALESLPTAVLVDRDGRQTGRVVGWDSDGLQALLSVPITREAPTRKPGCAAKNTYDRESLRALDGAGAFDELEDMFELGWTDGLPVVPPTRERVEAMLGGRDPDAFLGEMPPAMARVTLERVAACAVLAGCRPEYFPVVVAAVQAALEPAFNVGGQAVTTQPVGQVVVVNGPVRETVGLNGGVGALGPGWRPNMTIGRALRLVISLTGGGFPGRLDRSALGQPGKVGLCFAEDEEVSPVGAAARHARLSGGPLGGHGVRRRRAAVDLRSPQHGSGGAGPGPGGGGGRYLEPDLVAARRHLAVRDLPRARSLVRRVGLEQAASPRVDLRSGATAGGFVALGRDDAARPRGRRRSSWSASGRAPRTSSSSSPAARRAASQPCSDRASG